MLCYIVKTDGTQIVETISCKNTDGDSVSVGQHKADDICDAIDPSNDELRNLLNKWQIEGTLSAFSEADSARLTELLNPLMEKFCNYVIGGVGGLGDQTTQWARYVIVCHADPNDIDVYTLQKYVEQLLAQPTEHYGTPFSWTYASKSKGKNIQFKVSV